MSTDLSKISIDEFKELTSSGLGEAILSLGKIIDHLSVGSPWRDDVVTMLLKLREMQVQNDE